MTRRELLAAVTAAGSAAHFANPQTAPVALTKFQIGCMTMPYSRFPLQRALDGIAKAGCRYVGLGGSHMESGNQRKPVIPVEGSPSDARRLAQRCRDSGLEPALMFGGISAGFYQRPYAADQASGGRWHSFCRYIRAHDPREL
jgi:hypothetical protein